MVRVYFNLLDTTAENEDGDWRRCACPPLLACLRHQASTATFDGPDVELAAARLAIRAWGGHVVAMSYPRRADAGQRGAS